jgi:hypothetical protein
MGFAVGIKKKGVAIEKGKGPQQRNVFIMKI